MSGALEAHRGKEARPFLAGRLAQSLMGLAIVAVMIGWLRLMGRPLACPCGHVSLWQGRLTATENSQQFSDWYSLLHGVFGIGLYAFTRWMKPHWTLAEIVLVALAGSAAWEAMENTPLLISLFAQSPGAPAYFGDSILNALGDTLFVALGCLAAARLPWPATLMLALAAEIAVTLAVDDGFVLGTLRLVGISV